MNFFLNEVQYWKEKQILVCPFVLTLLKTDFYGAAPK